MKDKQLVLDELKDLQEKLSVAREKLDLSMMKIEVEKLKKEMLSDGFWDNIEKATETSKRVASMENKLETWEGILIEFEIMLETISELADVEMKVIEEEVKILLEKGKVLYLETLFTGELDRNSAIISIICGTGGKDAQDFTEMLGKMYVRYAEKQGFGVEKLEETRGEEVGLKNISFLIKGENAYGFLKNEHGVHRLVRQSPFNSGNTRETSFAMVDVIPAMENDDFEIEINEDDLKIDTFRASGAGGQHVNVTDSAVRITHLPTGVVVTSQSERSQHQNKEKAMQVLYGKLYQLQQEKNLSSIEELRGVKVEMSWGNQIRSYVVHPYKMVKDHRTNFETSDVEGVLYGDIQAFIEAKLLG